uniref:Uncharacterized protein n=1 Tax=Opuntia streptacantha TaxID=393608 RepID=A0A7C9AQF5_OPUST
MRFKIIATVALSAGCNMGPITVPGFIETKSMPFSLENFHAASSAKTFEMLYHFAPGYSSQCSGLENQHSSTITLGVRGCPVNRTADIEDVKITLLTDALLLQAPRTLSVPFTAGSSTSAWGSTTLKLTGEAVWKTPSHPAMATSKEPSSIKSALNRRSLSFAPSSLFKCSVFALSSTTAISIEHLYMCLPLFPHWEK